MPEEDNPDRRLRKLTVEHAETRWLALRLDDDVKVLHEDMRTVQATQREHTARFDSIDDTLREHTSRLDSVEATLQKHTARFDSVDGQLRSLTQMVGQALERLPEKPCGTD